MWNLNALAKNLQEQVEKAGLNAHLVRSHCLNPLNRQLGMQIVSVAACLLRFGPS